MENQGGDDMSNANKHLGAFVREHVIPKSLSVTEAARRLGVSRSALSRLLNGKVPVSLKMATRLSEAFNFDLQLLLSMKHDFERQVQHKNDQSVGVKRFAPLLAGMRTLGFEVWMNEYIFRSRFGVLWRIVSFMLNGDIS